MKSITSRDNPRIKRLRKWASQGRARRDEGAVLLDGLHLIEAFLAANGQLSEIVVSDGGIGKQEISDWLAQHSATDVLLVPDALFADIAVTESPSGIVGVGSAFPSVERPSNEVDCVLLDSVQDPGNVGTLLRTAAAAGIKQALLGPGCADPWAPKTLRAGQGAQFQLAIHESCDLVAFLNTYQGAGVATRLDASQSLYDTTLEGPLAWVFGAEGQGVSAPVAAAVKLGVCIPMPGKVESLNVAAAAAICLFEMVRRRSL